MRKPSAEWERILSELNEYTERGKSLQDMFPRSVLDVMKHIFINFWVVLLILSFSNQTFSNQTTSAIHTTDWSSLFPEIPNCQREIKPIAQDGKIIYQTANYYRKDLIKYEMTSNYAVCGSITLRFEPSARKSAHEKTTNVNNSPFMQTLKIKGFDAYRDSPKCGNDTWIGSTAVYFDEDKVLFVSAIRGAGTIMDFANNADYKIITKAMNKVIKKETR